MALQGSTQDEETRVLLLLFGLEGLGQLVKKTKLGICRSNEKASDYTPIFEGLVQQGLISYGTRKASKKKASSEPVADQNILSLTQAGYDHLITALKSGDFQLKGQQFGSKVVNALIKLIREAPSSPSPEVSPQISSYDQFKAVALETYDQLNRDYNYDHLVPIYRIRRAIGARVTRSQFNDWMLELQSNDVLQLQGGGVEDDASDKLEDSILTKVSGLRCYAKKII